MVKRNKKVKPREERLSWSDRHMLEALLASQRSPDPNTQVGSCIVTPKNRIIGSGYNSFPNGITTQAFSWAREGDTLETKYPYVVHAEKNAIYNSSYSVEGCTLYTTLFPCNECAKDIIQSGIKHIIYLKDLYPTAWATVAAKEMFDQVDLTYTKHKWQDKKVVIQCLNSIITLMEV